MAQPLTVTYPRGFYEYQLAAAAPTGVVVDMAEQQVRVVADDLCLAILEDDAKALSQMGDGVDNHLRLQARATCWRIRMARGLATRAPSQYDWEPA